MARKKTIMRRYSFNNMTLQVVCIESLHFTRYIPLCVDKRNGLHTAAPRRVLGTKCTRAEAQAELDAFARKRELKEV